jgi:ABC-type phosphate transport system substrate-binding protein
LKVKGVKWYNEVWLYCKNQSAFETEDGKSLQSPIELHTLLGKKNNEQVPAEGIEVPILIKASEETIQANKANETLLMSVGNTTNAAAYLSEQEVLTWKKAVPVIEVSDATELIDGNYAKITLTNTGDPVKKEDILITWLGDHNQFTYYYYKNEENDACQLKNQALDKFIKDVRQALCLRQMKT